ncbi:hypothetical protein GBAR_LOCUS15998 [Geodia barretti]|uniref:Uncharacterized protein n=1 Tax=Geodia barretti TaxID=519541 RepID=A0AA35SDN5_GEOBA|nr:hypothetical protein GBAR_LOCUS15998 [Geodia barretti]
MTAYEDDITGYSVTLEMENPPPRDPYNLTVSRDLLDSTTNQTWSLPGHSSEFFFPRYTFPVWLSVRAESPVGPGAPSPLLQYSPPTSSGTCTTTESIGSLSRDDALFTNCSDTVLVRLLLGENDGSGGATGDVFIPIVTETGISVVLGPNLLNPHTHYTATLSFSHQQSLSVNFSTHHVQSVSIMEKAHGLLVECKFAEGSPQNTTCTVVVEGEKGKLMNTSRGPHKFPELPTGIYNVTVYDGPMDGQEPAVVRVVAVSGKPNAPNPTASDTESPMNIGLIVGIAVMVLVIVIGICIGMVLAVLYIKKWRLPRAVKKKESKESNLPPRVQLPNLNGTGHSNDIELTPMGNQRNEVREREETRESELSAAGKPTQEDTMETRNRARQPIEANAGSSSGPQNLPPKPQRTEIKRSQVFNRVEGRPPSTGKGRYKDRDRSDRDRDGKQPGGNNYRSQSRPSPKPLRKQAPPPPPTPPPTDKTLSTNTTNNPRSDPNSGPSLSTTSSSTNKGASLSSTTSSSSSTSGAKTDGRRLSYAQMAPPPTDKTLSTNTTNNPRSDPNSGPSLSTTASSTNEGASLSSTASSSS